MSVGLWFSIILPALSQVIDEQLILEKKPQDTETIIWLCDSATNIQGKNPILSKSIGELALKKSNEWNVKPFTSILAKKCIAEALFIQEKFEASMKANEEALLLFETVKGPSKSSLETKLRIELNLVKSKIALGLHSNVKIVLDSILVTAKKNNYPEIEMLSYEAYTALFEKDKNFEMALVFYSKMTAADLLLKDSELNNIKNELTSKYKMINKEREIIELEKENELERTYKNILIILFATTFSILLIAIISANQKRKKEQLISQLELQQLSRKIITKTNEITTYTLNFLQKNQLMEDLKQQINDLKSSTTINKNKELTRINRIVDNTFRSDEEWKTFQVTFDQMHDGFFKDLKHEFPDISNAELKLCALLRLNMNLKESAKILGIAPDSVKTARYRLRKKLGLKTEDNLVDFLIQFDRSNK